MPTDRELRLALAQVDVRRWGAGKLRVLLVVHDADGRGLSLRDLEWSTGLSLGGVGRALDGLVADGVLKVGAPGSGGRAGVYLVTDVDAWEHVPFATPGGRDAALRRVRDVDDAERGLAEAAALLDEALSDTVARATWSARDVRQARASMERALGDSGVRLARASMGRAPDDLLPPVARALVGSARQRYGLRALWSARHASKPSAGTPSVCNSTPPPTPPTPEGEGGAVAPEPIPHAVLDAWLDVLHQPLGKYRAEVEAACIGIDDPLKAARIAARMRGSNGMGPTMLAGLIRDAASAERNRPADDDPALFADVLLAKGWTPPEPPAAVEGDGPTRECPFKLCDGRARMLGPDGFADGLVHRCRCHPSFVADAAVDAFEADALQGVLGLGLDDDTRQLVSARLAELRGDADVPARDDRPGGAQ